MVCQRLLATLYAALGALSLLTILASPSSAAQYKVLYKFANVEDGYFPNAGLVIDAAGNLYGTTYYGGPGNSIGTVFKLAPDQHGGWTKSILYAFSDGADGGFPGSDLIFDNAGNLYGTTVGGGANDMGTVFKLTPKPDGTWTESVLYSFAGGPDGAYPEAKVTIDASGNLYGTTRQGGTGCGADGCGTVFKLMPSPGGSWTEQQLYRFSGGRDGHGPYAGVIFDGSGNLYSTTGYGGTRGNTGTAFKLTPNPDDTWTETVITRFHDQPSGIPYAGLIFDGAGNLYGTTVSGTVYKLSPNPDGSWNKRVIYDFGYPTQIYTGLTLDAAGRLYGVADGPDTLFRLKRGRGGWTLKVLHSFNNSDMPFGALVFDPSGNIYGTTRYGGNGGCGNLCGQVFEVTP